MIASEYVKFIEKRIEEVGKTKKEFYSDCNVSAAMMSNWRKDINYPSMTVIQNINEYLHINVGLADLTAVQHETNAEVKRLAARVSRLDAHGMSVLMALLEIEEKRVADQVSRRTAEITSVIPMIRHYFSSPAAGVGGMEAGEDYEDIPLPDGAPQNADYCLTVSGDSMEPYFSDGSLVYVMRDAPMGEFDVGIFIVDGIAYIKQLCHGYNGEIYLLSSNPKRREANITIYPDSDTRLEYRGRVIVKKKLPQPIYD